MKNLNQISTDFNSLSEQEAVGVIVDWLSDNYDLDFFVDAKIAKHAGAFHALTRWGLHTLSRDLCEDNIYDWIEEEVENGKYGWEN